MLEPPKALRQLDARTSEVQWTSALDGGSYSPTTWRGVAFGTGVYLTAFDASDGEVLWTRRDIEGPGVPSAVGNRLYVASLKSQTLYCLDLRTGRDIWVRPDSDPQRGPLYSTPAIAQTSLFLSAQYVNPSRNVVMALDARSGEQLWAVPTATRGVDSPLPCPMGSFTRAPTMVSLDSTSRPARCFGGVPMLEACKRRPQWSTATWSS
jgi:outer membrane protein assembly factor BamB